MVHFNTEHWIMLMGFPPDYQEEQYNQDAIGSFGKFLYWQEEERRLTIVIIRASVIDLQSIPHFIVSSDLRGLKAILRLYSAKSCSITFLAVASARGLSP